MLPDGERSGPYSEQTAAQHLSPVPLSKDGVSIDIRFMLQGDLSVTVRALSEGDAGIC